MLLQKQAFGLLPWLRGGTRKKMVGMDNMGDTLHIFQQMNEAFGFVSIGDSSVAWKPESEVRNNCLNA